MKGHDLTGKTFNNLKVLCKSTKRMKQKTICWVCYCNRCRELSVVTSGNLLHQKNKNCQNCKKRLFDYEKEQEIYAEFLAGANKSELSRKYNCSRATIYGIIKRRKK